MPRLTTPIAAEERVQQRFARLSAHYGKFEDDALTLAALAIADELARRGREPLRILTSNVPAHLEQQLRAAGAAA